MTTGTTGTTLDRTAALDALGQAIGVKKGEHRARGWFTRLASRYFKRNLERYFAHHQEGAPAPERAEKAIFRACVKSAVSGAVSGGISTAASVVTAQTQGTWGFVAVPLAGLAIVSEMMLRSVVHIDLTCELAEIFGVKFDADDEDDFWRLYALVFKAHGADGERDEEDEAPGKELVEKVTHVEGEEVGERIGHVVLGESLMRNIVPFVGIFSSAVTNYVLTWRLGNTVRRAMRYERAMRDALTRAEGLCRSKLNLLVEGIWFIFTADGKLDPEETVCLANLLADLDPEARAKVTARFTDDEIDWMQRIKTEVPEDMRDAFLHALEVAAAVDKENHLAGAEDPAAGGLHLREAVLGGSARGHRRGVRGSRRPRAGWRASPREGLSDQAGNRRGSRRGSGRGAAACGAGRTAQRICARRSFASAAAARRRRVSYGAAVAPMPSQPAASS